MNILFFILSLMLSTDYPYTRGIYIGSTVINSPYTFKNLLYKTENANFNTIIFDIRDDRGFLYLPKDSLIPALYARYPINMDSLIFQLHKKGFTVSARIVAMKDYSYINVDSTILLHKKDGTVFRDSSGAYFLNPENEKTKQYLKIISAKCAEMGFDDIQLDYIRYPTEGKIDSIDMPNIAERINALTNIIKEISDTLSIYGTTLSADVFGFLIWYEILKVPSQSWYDFSFFLDQIHPMIYPSHYPKNYAFVLNKYMRTYRIISNSLYHANEISKGVLNHLKIIPYIQAFDYKKDWMGKFYITQQLLYTEMSPAKGYILYHSSSGYPFETFLYPLSINMALPFIRKYAHEFYLGLDRGYRYGIYTQ